MNIETNKKKYLGNNPALTHTFWYDVEIALNKEDSTPKNTIGF